MIFFVRRLIFLFLLPALIPLVSGCGSSQESAAGSGDNPFSGDANPVYVSARSDDSRAASANISAAGGLVTTTAADGTKFTLVVPPDALLSSETITIKPVTAIDGLPLSGGLTAAVQMEPEGLELLSPAMLQITPARPLPAGQQIPFAYTGSGSEFFLAARTMDSSRIDLLVSHFSGTGIGLGSGSDLQGQQQHNPSSAQDRLVQQVGALQDQLIQHEAEYRSNGSWDSESKDTVAQIKAVLLAYDHDVIVPELDAAENNEDMLMTAAQDFIFWRNFARTVYSKIGNGGLDGDIYSASRTDIDQLVHGIENAWAKEKQKCANKDLSAIQKLAQLAQVSLMIGRQDMANQILQSINDSCAKIAVSFESKGSVGGQGATWVYDLYSKYLKASYAIVTAPTPPEIIAAYGQQALGAAQSALVKLTIKGALTYADYHTEGIPGCTPHTDKSGSTLSATGEIDLNLRQGKTGPPDISLAIDPGGPTDSYYLECPYIGRSNDANNVWATGWSLMYGKGMTLNGISPQAGPPVKKTFDKTAQAGEGTYQDETTISVGFGDDQDLQDLEVQR